MKPMTIKRLRATAYVMPAFAIHLLLAVVPAFSMVYYALTSWNGLGSPKFIGLANFARMAGDQDFLYALYNNVVYMALFMTVPLAMGLGFALLFSKMGKAQLVFRVICFLPYVVGSAVAGKIFAMFFSPYVGIGELCRSLGLNALATFAPLGDQNQALYAVAFVDNWHWWGFVLILMMSALHQLDVSLTEAAIIDGAGPFRRLLRVTIPQIMPTISSYFIFVLVSAFKAFDYVWVMTQGGPARATELAATWIYKRTFLSYEAGYGTALSLSVCAVCIAIYLIVDRIRGKGEANDYAA